MSKVIENTTVLDIELNDIGITIHGNNGTYDLDDKPSWNVEKSTDLLVGIQSGDLLLIKSTSPTVYYTAIQAERILLRKMDTVLAGGDSGTILTFNENSIGWEDMGIDGFTPLGHIYNEVFIDDDKAKNKWLSHYGDGSSPSNMSPAVVPWDCKLVAATFTNQLDDVDIDIEIYSAAEGSGNTDALKTSWSLTNIRTARKTNFSDIYFNAGDKIGVFLKDTGGDAQRIVIILYLQVIAVNSTESSDNYSGNF